MHDFPAGERSEGEATSGDNHLQTARAAVTVSAVAPKDFATQVGHQRLAVIGNVGRILESANEMERIVLQEGLAGSVTIASVRHQS